MQLNSARPVVIYALTAGIAALIPFLMLAVMTRHLPPDAYGAITAFTLAVAILNPIVGFSAHGAISIRYFQPDLYDLSRYIGACVLILALVSIPLLGLVLVFGSFVAGYLELPFNTGWLVVALIIAVCQFIAQIGLFLWQASGQAWSFGALKIMQALTDAAVTLILVILIGWEWQGRLTGMLVGSVCAATVVTTWLLQCNQLRVGGAPSYIPDALRFGFPMVFHGLGGLLITAGDKIAVGSMLSLAELGNYAVAAQIMMMLNLFFDSIFRAFHPWIISNAIKPLMQAVVVTRIYLLLLVTALVGFAFFGVAYMGYEHLVGVKYIHGRDVLLPLTVAAVLRCGYFATAVFINIANMNRLLAVNSIFSGCVGLATAVVLTPELGLLGAAYGMVVSELFGFLLNWHASARVFPMPWIAVFKRGRK